MTFVYKYVIIKIMREYRNSKVEYVRCWKYKSKKDYCKCDTFIEIDEDMQIPYCYLFRVYGEVYAKICFLAELGGIGKYVAFVDNNNFLYAGFASNIIKYDLKENKLVKNIIDGEWIHNFFELEDGFLLHQEMTIKFYDKELNLLWKDEECADIFANLIISENYEIGKDYIAIIDWCGNKHFYNKYGKFKIEKTKYNSHNYKKPK